MRIEVIDGAELLNCCDADSNADELWDMLSEVYNMPGLPDRVYEIVGDVMLKLHDDESELKHGM